MKIRWLVEVRPTGKQWEWRLIDLGQYPTSWYWHGPDHGSARTREKAAEKGKKVAAARNDRQALYDAQNKSHQERDQLWERA